MSAQKYLVEFIGTFFLVFTIGMAVIAPGGAGDMAPIAIGAVLMVMVYAGGHISGAHYNPAVTAAVCGRGKCAPADVVPYMIAQSLAAVCAASLAPFLKVDEVITPITAHAGPVLISEALFTFALCWVVLNVATARANAGNSYYGLAIGFIVVAGAYSVGAISGGAFNPAVTIGLGVMGIINWPDIWMYLVGQFGGAILAVVAFKMLVRDQS